MVQIAAIMLGFALIAGVLLSIYEPGKMDENKKAIAAAKQFKQIEDASRVVEPYLHHGAGQGDVQYLSSLQLPLTTAIPNLSPRDAAAIDKYDRAVMKAVGSGIQEPTCTDLANAGDMAMAECLRVAVMNKDFVTRSDDGGYEFASGNAVTDKMKSILATEKRAAIETYTIDGQTMQRVTMQKHLPQRDAKAFATIQQNIMDAESTEEVLRIARRAFALVATKPMMTSRILTLAIGKDMELNPTATVPHEELSAMLNKTTQIISSREDLVYLEETRSLE